jgi:uncharacterized membrane protein
MIGAMSRSTWILVFVFLHVLGAIAAVGPTLTYGLWIARAERAGLAVRAFVLNTVSWVDAHLATPAFILQAGTGTALILLERRSLLHTAWLLMGVGVYVITALFAVLVYAPVVKRQISLADRIAGDPENPELRADYAVTATRARTLGVTAVVLTVAILYFMIVKPTLWSAG